MAKRSQNTGCAKDKQPAHPTKKTIREEQQSEDILVLKAEIEKLKNELADTLETVDIYKQVIADLSRRQK